MKNGTIVYVKSQGGSSYSYPRAKRGKRILYKNGNFTQWAKLVLAIANEPGRTGKYYYEKVYGHPKTPGKCSGIFAMIHDEDFVTYNPKTHSWTVGPNYPF